MRLMSSTPIRQRRIRDLIYPASLPRGWKLEGGKNSEENVGSHKILSFCPSLSTPSIVTAWTGSHARIFLPRSISQGDIQTSLVGGESVRLERKTTRFGTPRPPG